MKDDKSMFIMEIPVEDFLAIITLVSQAADRNHDPRIKGFYLGIIRKLRAAYDMNATVLLHDMGHVCEETGS